MSQGPFDQDEYESGRGFGRGLIATLAKASPRSIKNGVEAYEISRARFAQEVAECATDDEVRRAALERQHDACLGIRDELAQYTSEVSSQAIMQQLCQADTPELVATPQAIDRQTATEHA